MCTHLRGFAIARALYNNDKSAVIGVQTRAMGLDKNGEQSDQYQPSMRIEAKHVFVAEGEGCDGWVGLILLQQ